MVTSNKEKIYKLLKSIETGGTDAVAFVNEAKYIQHNPQTHEGSEGLAVLFKRLSDTSPKVNIVRIFEDGAYVFAHTEYDFSARNIGFEIFRFEEGQAVEHWDNIQKRHGPNRSGHTMVDGAVTVEESEETELNRATIQRFIRDVLISQKMEKIEHFINIKKYQEHNPELGNDLSEFKNLFSSPNQNEMTSLAYLKCHFILAEGNFVLSVCEGVKNHVPSSFFDLFRLVKGKIVEHWDTTEAIPPSEQWKNNNGKF